MFETTDESSSAGEFEADQRDITSLWSEAEQRYTKLTGKKLTRFRRTLDLLDYADKQMDDFHRYRHDHGKVDKMRTLFMKNVRYIEAGTTAIVQAVTPAFPPAATIGTALCYVLNASKEVSADYDLIIMFFEDMKSFLERITILEGRIPRHRAYQNCLIDVFASLLEMCGHAEKAIKSKRLKKWFLKMILADTDAVAESRDDMNRKLARLESATKNAILANTEESKRMDVELKQNQEESLSMLKRQEELMQARFDELQSSVQQMDQKIQAKIDVALAWIENSVAKGGQKVQTGPETHLNSVTAIGPEKVFMLLKEQLEYGRAQVLDPNLQSQQKEAINEEFVIGTYEWLLNEPAFQSWAQEEGPPFKVLGISGSSGYGKTSIATFVYECLLKSAENQDSPTSSTCVSLVLLPKDAQRKTTDASIMSAAISQAAKQNTNFCDAATDVLLGLARKYHSVCDDGILETSIAALFSPPSSFRLQIVLDGVDYLNSITIEAFTNTIRDLRGKDIRISLLLLYRPSLSDRLALNESETITLGLEKQQKDYKKVIEHCIDRSRKLSNLPDYVKEVMVEKLSTTSNGYLFIQHVICEADAMARPSSVEKMLTGNLPRSFEELFLTMTASFEKRLSIDQISAIKIVLIWVGCAFSPLTLRMISSILILAKRQDLDIEEELIQSQLKRFLALKSSASIDPSHRYDYGAELFEDQMFTDDLERLNQKASSAALIDDDGTICVEFWDDRMRDFFTPESLPIQQESPRMFQSKLRTCLSEAHRQIFITCANVLLQEGVHKTQLSRYAASSWWMHHGRVDFDHHSFEDQLEFLEITASLFRDETKLATNLIAQETVSTFLAGSALDLPFEDIMQGFVGLKSIQSCVRKASQSHLTGLTQSSREWCLAVQESDQAVLLPLTKGLVRQWFRTEDERQIVPIYNLAFACWNLAKYPYELKCLDAFDMRQQKIAEDILETANLIEDEAKDAAAQIAIGRTIIENVFDFEKAIPMFQEAVKKSETGSRLRFLALLSIADAAYQDITKHASVAENAIEECLNNANDASPRLRSYAYQLKATIALENDKPNVALIAYEQARGANHGLVDGWHLGFEVETMRKLKGPESAAALMREWSTESKILYSISGAPQNIYELAAAIDDRKFLSDIYEGAILLQDGSPLQIDYAQGLCRAERNPTEAKRLAKKVLDNPPDQRIYSIMHRDQDDVFVECLSLLWHLCYEEFRSTTKPQVKLDLCAEVRSLAMSNFTQIVRPRPRTMIRHMMVVARMMKKVGPAIEFQAVANKAFNHCCDELDLEDLSCILSLLDGFEEESKVLACARAYNRMTTDPWDSKPTDDATARKNNTQTENKDGGSTAARPDDEHAADALADRIDSRNGTESLFLAHGQPVECSGPCSKEGEGIYTWEERGKMFHCLICCVLLCPQCYDIRQAWNRGERGARCVDFCGVNHEYVQLPLLGWKGIRRGMIQIEGRADVHCKDYLDEIKNVKWPEAWDRFWAY